LCRGEIDMTGGEVAVCRGEVGMTGGEAVPNRKVRYHIGKL